jgi:hypothetical protein
MRLKLTEVTATGQQLQYFYPDSTTTSGPAGTMGQWYVPMQRKDGEQSWAEAAVTRAKSTNSTEGSTCNRTSRGLMNIICTRQNEPFFSEDHMDISEVLLFVRNYSKLN